LSVYQSSCDNDSIFTNSRNNFSIFSARRKEENSFETISRTTSQVSCWTRPRNQLYHKPIAHIYKVHH
jgi:hypothetical protein